MISQKYKFIFSHVIKTGGTSVEFSLRKFHTPVEHPYPILGNVERCIPSIRGGELNFTNKNHKAKCVSEIGAKAKWHYECMWKSHITAYQYKIFLENEDKKIIWDDYFKFAFVRNPYHYMVSLFVMFAKRKHFVQKHDKFLKKIPTEFNLFVERFVDTDDRLLVPLDYHSNVQSDWVTDKNENILFDFIGRLESIQVDYDYICGNVGIETHKLVDINKSEKQSNKSVSEYMDFYNTHTKKLVYKYFEKDFDLFKYKS